ncbi:hypothetical protein [Variovorax boronicumulans]|uniref:hypothetical protein n=1 Tax=Variovorax boronicumulans TaxID=436515 RepID=UPI00142E6897|nr:hypothetical protein [Variovorax boronicumulans]
MQERWIEYFLEVIDDEYLVDQEIVGIPAWQANAGNRLHAAKRVVRRFGAGKKAIGHGSERQFLLSRRSHLALIKIAGGWGLDPSWGARSCG